MVQVRRDARLVEEHLDEARIARVLRADPLEHHVPLEPLDAIGPREEHVRHPPGREAPEDPIPP